VGLSWIADDAAQHGRRRPLTRPGQAPAPGDATRGPAHARPRGLAAAAAWISEAAGAHLAGAPARRPFRRYWV
jgi:hypothetical protein